MTTKNNHLLCAAACLFATMAAGAAHGQAIQIVFRDNGQAAFTPAESVITAAHGAGLDPSFNVFNNLTINGVEPGTIPVNLGGATQGLSDGQGNALGSGASAPFFVHTELSSFASGITDPSISADPFTVDFSTGFTAGAFNGAEDTQNPGLDGPDGTGLYEGLFFSRPGDLGVGFLVGGLAADTYDVFYYSAEANANPARSSDVTFQALGAGDFDAVPSEGVNDPLAAGSNVDAFEDGVNFARFQLDVAAGGSIAIFQQITSGADFASIGAIQIIPSSLLDTTGDVDGNGLVDLNDFNILRDNFFSNDTSAGNFGVDSALGEAVGAIDGVVDLQDFIIFRNAFEAAGGNIGALTFIPEPSAMLILCVTLAGSLSRQRRS